jgi:hypothetical protein
VKGALMIYEIRTYQLSPGRQAEVEKRYGEAYQYRRKYSELTGFFHTEIGPLNEIIHIWRYQDLAERARIRAEAAKDANWPPKIQEFIRKMTSEIVMPFGFVPQVQPGKLGPIFEWREYEILPGMMGEVYKNWEKALPKRRALSSLVMAMHTDSGELNKFVHIWSYESLNHRAEVRKEAAAKGIWPPKSRKETLKIQENKIVLAAPFSPLA